MSDILFVNVDTLDDFMSPSGSLYVPGAEEIRPALQKITAFARKADYKIINIADCHTEGSKEISANPDYKYTYPPHCMKGTKGAEFIEETSPTNPYVISHNSRKFDIGRIAASQEIIIQKDNVGIFTNMHAANLFKILEPKNIYVYGVVTEICVDRVVVGLVKRGYRVAVFIDAVKELPGTDRWKTFGKWTDLGGSLTATGYLVETTNGL